jgi:3-hydroxyisobutyrate dehydrogenase
MKIGLIGIGLMGQALSERLLERQHTLTIYNRSPNKTAALQSQGAQVVSNANAVIQASDITLFMLSDADAIHSVLDTTTADSVNNKLIIQMGTIAPAESREIADRIRQQQGQYLESPVLGSLPEARSGTLIIMAGGQEADYQTALPLLQDLSKEPRHTGDVGHGATIKLAMNQLIAGLTSSFALSLALVEKEQIDVSQFMDIVRDSALYAPTFDKKLDRMLNRDFSNPNFPTKHLAKDTHLFLSVAKQLGLNTAALQGIAEVLDATLEQGLADTDYSAVFSGVSPE